jgi:hypothetical protein
MKAKLNFEEEKYFGKAPLLTRTVRGEQKGREFQPGVDERSM